MMLAYRFRVAGMERDAIASEAVLLAQAERYRQDPRKNEKKLLILAKKVNREYGSEEGIEGLSRAIRLLISNPFAGVTEVERVVTALKGAGHKMTDWAASCYMAEAFLAGNEQVAHLFALQGGKAADAIQIAQNSVDSAKLHTKDKGERAREVAAKFGV